MSDHPQTHLECMICKEWKHQDEMYSDGVCLVCSKNYDKHGCKIIAYQSYSRKKKL